MITLRTTAPSTDSTHMEEKEMGGLTETGDMEKGEAVVEVEVVASEEATEVEEAVEEEEAGKTSQAGPK